jgi:hypothetical protein
LPRDCLDAQHQEQKAKEPHEVQDRTSTPVAAMSTCIAIALQARIKRQPRIHAMNRYGFSCMVLKLRIFTFDPKRL